MSDIKKDKNIKSKQKQSNKEVVELKKAVEELNNKFLRTLSDLKNQKRIHQEEISKLKQYEGECLILKILDVLDDFERAISTVPENMSDELKKYLSGFEMIYAGLLTTLKETGVVEIDCLNKEFDPHIAEAMLTEPSKDKESNIVTGVMLKGYMYKEKVLRPAKVKVSE